MQRRAHLRRKFLRGPHDAPRVSLWDLGRLLEVVGRAVPEALVVNEAGVVEVGVVVAAEEPARAQLGPPATRVRTRARDLKS